MTDASAPAAPSAPLVAIVTPVYNGAEFLAETMNCVQRQTYPNLVHVVLDNASTDATPEILARYRNLKVPVVTARNPSLLSMDENWNASLKLVPAEAKYFRILCADDVIFPDATTQMVAQLEADPKVMVVTSSVMRNEVREDFKWPKDRTVFEGREALQRYFTIQGTIEARQMMLRTASLRQDDPFFDLRSGHSSDIDAALRMLTRGRLGFVHEPLAMVREHPGNASQSEMRPLYMHFHDWLTILKRYGPNAFGDAYRKLERRYVRFYTRKMLIWRFIKGNHRAFTTHMDLLKQDGARPGLLEFADAAFDLVLKRLGLREGWYSYPY